LVATCLVKDPKKRPSSEKLLKHHFFRHARASKYLARTILDGLAPLGDRFRTLKVCCSFASSSILCISCLGFCYQFLLLVYQAKEADLLVQNKALYEDKDQLSQVGLF